MSFASFMCMHVPMYHNHLECDVMNDVRAQECLRSHKTIEYFPDFVLYITSGNLCVCYFANRDAGVCLPTQWDDLCVHSTFMI